VGPSAASALVTQSVFWWKKLILRTFFKYCLRVQCLSNLAHLQQGVQLGAGQLAQMAVSSEVRSSRSKRDSFHGKQPATGDSKSTDKLLHEKDEEIRKMQQMLQQMQAKLQQSSGPNSLNNITTV
jgi:hypothetical protein